jgi:rhamnose utilization protein RhaD (predicted bifunctional aldolase and dehydrogenase)
MRPPALKELEAFSAAIGADPEQVQAAGGNTSLKEAGLLWVKASGLWLADAEKRDIFVPVALEQVLDGIGAGAADPVSAAVVAALNPEGLRPSIETTLHALLPHRIVVHTHSVRTLALAIREDGEARIAERLLDLRWAWIPYCKPGLPLTREVAACLAAGPVDVLVLGNHGLVVGAPTVPEAAALLAEVERRLDAPVQPAPGGSRAPLASLAQALGLREPVHPAAHALAMNRLRLERAVTGSLYPDHVIFLGPAATGLPAGADAPELAAAVAAAAERGGKLFLVPGAGALLAAGTTASADELALCLALVLERVPEDAALRCLRPEAEAELLDWDAEKYRQSLASTRAAQA